MAIKVGTTTLIDDSFKLQNIAGANGKYDNFSPSPAVITNVIDFDTPMMSCAMEGNVTFTESNKANARSAMLLLDTSSDLHTPTFSANMKWSSGSEPDWSGFRHWQIAFHCYGPTTVRATAVGYNSTIPPEVISLSGTSGSPASAGALFPPPTFVGNVSGGRRAYRLTHTIRFTSAGNIDTYNEDDGVRSLSTTQWNNITPSKTYYIRVTDHDTGSPTRRALSFQNNGGPALNTWHALTSSRAFGAYEYYEIPGTPIYGGRSVAMKVEISDQSNGSNILATGYYVINWEGYN